VRLLAVKGPRLELFNEAEALRLGRSGRQLDIASQFYERIALSQNQSRDAGESKELRTDRLSFRTKNS
jgi:predicted nuclease of restriction endonuclease-like (RecB) superfamily